MNEVSSQSLVFLALTVPLLPLAYLFIFLKMERVLSYRSNEANLDYYFRFLKSEFFDSLAQRKKLDFYIHGLALTIIILTQLYLFTIANSRNFSQSYYLVLATVFICNLVGSTKFDSKEEWIQTKKLKFFALSHLNEYFLIFLNLMNSLIIEKHSGEGNFTLLISSILITGILAKRSLQFSFANNSGKLVEKFRFITLFKTSLFLTIFALNIFAFIAKLFPVVNVLTELSIYSFLLFLILIVGLLMSLTMTDTLGGRRLLNINITSNRVPLTVFIIGHFVHMVLI